LRGVLRAFLTIGEYILEKNNITTNNKFNYIPLVNHTFVNELRAVTSKLILQRKQSTEKRKKDGVCIMREIPHPS